MHRAVLAEHQLAVGKFERLRQARIGDGINLRALGEFGEDRMQFGIAEHADVMDRRAERAQREGHDRAVAAELLGLRNDFEIRALARGRRDLGAEALDAGERRVLGRRLALLHHVKNLVDEAVETQQTLELKELRARTNKAFRRLTGKPGIRNHFVFLSEKDWRDKLCRLT